MFAQKLLNVVSQPDPIEEYVVIRGGITLTKPARKNLGFVPGIVRTVDEYRLAVLFIYECGKAAL
jgi:hypothetical protein